MHRFESWSRDMLVKRREFICFFFFLFFFYAYGHRRVALCREQNKENKLSPCQLLKPYVAVIMNPAFNLIYPEYALKYPKISDQSIFFESDEF